MEILGFVDRVEDGKTVIIFEDLEEEYVVDDELTSIEGKWVNVEVQDGDIVRIEENEGESKKRTKKIKKKAKKIRKKSKGSKFKK